MRSANIFYVVINERECRAFYVSLNCCKVSSLYSVVCEDYVVFSHIQC